MMIITSGRLGPSSSSTLILSQMICITLFNHLKARKFAPKYKTLCQLLLDIYGSDIRKNLPLELIQGIWLYSSSILFLKWFMTSPHNEAFAINRNAGWSLIKYLLRYARFELPFPNDEPKARLDLMKEKIKFLVEKGASLHYIEDGKTLTSIAMKSAAGFYIWCEVLQELRVDIHAFLQEEAEQSPFGLSEWSKSTSFALFLFREQTLNKSKRDMYAWDDKRFCSRCEYSIPTFWKFYLAFCEKMFSKFSKWSNDEVDDPSRIEDAGQIKIGEAENDDDSRQDDEVSDEDDECGNGDDEFGSDDKIRNNDKAENDHEVEKKANAEIESKGRNEDEIDDDEKVGKDKQAEKSAMDDDKEVGDDDKASDEGSVIDGIYTIYTMSYAGGLCQSCQEAYQLMNDIPMPGSFDPS